MDKSESRSTVQSLLVSDESGGPLTKGQNTILLPVRLAWSRPAQKAYVLAILLLLVSGIVLVISCVTFGMLYYLLVPAILVQRPVFLQYEYGHNDADWSPPQAMVTFGQELIANQEYDISLVLEVPRTPSNLQAGNFMLDLALISARADVLHLARRPTMLTYLSPMVESVLTISAMPLYVSGLRRQSQRLAVPMFTAIRFGKAANTVAESAHISIKADRKLEVYEMTLHIMAKLSGMRWMLYWHPLLSFAIITALAFASSIILAAGAGLLYIISMSSEVAVKDEPEPWTPLGSQIKQELKIEPTSSSVEDLDGTAAFEETARLTRTMDSAQLASSSILEADDEDDTDTGIYVSGLDLDHGGEVRDRRARS